MTRTRWAGILAGGLAICLAALLCLALYQVDNKYTWPGTQPMNGLLTLSREELEEQPLRYLVQDWEYWPGVLLTPETLQGHEGYRTYRSIGETSRLERRQAHGCGTYRLTLVLPEESASYALELPEVYSACRLYVGDRLVLELGDPEQENYSSALASRVVTFTASGTTELLLAVADYSAVYSGMTYPPAFGTVEAVLQAREGRLLLHGAMVLLSLLGLALALSFGLRQSRRRGLLCALICLCCLALTGYPLLHSLTTVSYQPWYTLELASFYLLLLLAVLLQCDLYGLWGLPAALFAFPCALGVLAALLRAGGAAHWNMQACLFFSGLAAFLKGYAALCLAGLSAWALWRGKRYSAALLAASLALGTCLVADRLLPLYEPVLGSWFSELGALCLSITLAWVLWCSAVDAYRFRQTYEREHRQLLAHLELQREHYLQLSHQIEQTRKWAHDLRHHMRLLRGMAQQDQRDAVLHYLDDYESHLDEQEITTFSDHPAADAILCHYAAAAREAGAVYDVRLPLSADLAFPADELGVLLGNLLENALDALSSQNGGERRLYLRGDAVDGRLRLLLENTYSGPLRERDGHFLSTKHGGTALGLRSVTSIATKYGGLADFTAQGGVFRSKIMIPLPAAPLRQDEAFATK